MQHSLQTTNLADILERVLDKGIVIAGDVTISLVQIDLLSIKLRLLIASVDKAKELGINWWEHDPQLSVRAEKLVEENQLLHKRLTQIENDLVALRPASGSNLRETSLSRMPLHKDQSAPSVNRASPSTPRRVD
ncbi:MAG: gas vesicle protein [Beijerinckiaceae bacterium]